MSARIIDGRAVAAALQDALRPDIQALAARGIVPGLGVLLIGDNPSSRIYVNMKKKACQKLGLYSEEITLPPDTDQAKVLAVVRRLNADPKIHGILVQLPLPPQLDTREILVSVDPAKDVDGFHPMNLGELLIGRGEIAPCTPLGIMKLLESLSFPFAGKRACVVGRSTIVGKPMAIMLLNRHMTVTICHSRTVDLPQEVGRADLVVAATGSPRLVQGAWIKPGAVVIDVGISREGEKLVGDVEFDEAVKRASHITPVPGGVGPMTIAMLVSNTVGLAKRLTS